MFGCTHRSGKSENAVVDALEAAGAADARSGRKRPWLLALALLAAGAGYAAYKRSTNKPDPWASATPYVPPTPSPAPAESSSSESSSDDSPADSTATGAAEPEAAEPEAAEPEAAEPDGKADAGEAPEATEAASGEDGATQK